MRSKNLGFFLFLFIFLSSAQAFAGSKVLATILRTSDKVKSELILITDQKRDIVRVVFKIYEEGGKLDREINVNPNELEEGKTVLSKLGVHVIALQSNNMALHNGGNVTIKYLQKYKLIGKSKYAKFDVLLDRVGDDWQLSKDGVPFTQLMAHIKKKGINRFEIVK